MEMGDKILSRCIKAFESFNRSGASHDARCSAHQEVVLRDVSALGAEIREALSASISIR